MLEYGYEWLRNLSGFLILSAVVLHLLPGKKYEKYIRFYMGLVLITLVLGPLIQLKNMGMPDFSHSSDAFEEKLLELEKEYEQR